MQKHPQQEKARTLQNILDISVKNVEIAKAHLDEATLISPLSGVVDMIEPYGIIPGVYITPSRFSITVSDPTSLTCLARVHEQERLALEKGKHVSVSS